MRVVALVLAGIAVGNVVLHDGLVRHEQCAEHGESAHAASLHALHEEHDDIALAGWHAVPAAEAHEDDHCPLATHPARAHAAMVLLIDDVERASANDARAHAPSTAPFARLAWRTPPATGPPALRV